MILPDPADPELVAGTVTLWSHDTGEGPLSGIGRMVLPEFQGLGLGLGAGLGRRAVRALPEQARHEDRWGVLHAFPATGNAASNGSCRWVGFRFVSVTDVTFAGRTVRAEHRSVAPANDPT